MTSFKLMLLTIVEKDCHNDWPLQPGNQLSVDNGYMSGDNLEAM